MGPCDVLSALNQWGKRKRKKAPRLMYERSLDEGTTREFVHMSDNLLLLSLP